MRSRCAALCSNRSEAVSARIDIVDDAVHFDCPEGVDVLHSMIALGRRGIPVGCRGGGCGVCKVRVLGGAYRTDRMSRARITEEEEKQGFALACKLYARGDLKLQVVGKMARAFAPCKETMHCTGAPHAPPGSTSWRR
ncbi:MAG: 2Fe-2S iron-sulfur cluster binding domain-containing protein [Nevskiaceae bacterium]|nr:MAG: 2Fe-2S iron-sulfur cluster binding domain-containing protein [Nevskiaceae bacterium]TBR72682.1 MAG: 2Fe-2S iron-sulfur cluster binding domain-containing protein [Nevskiaceae bacterium]